ncbi:uncharacterized protein LOC123545483 [Mercenaria mercenaria]|uniref:uncharacterized protein LOC123545483 n=1 Tax=Mercenaria mercenaria TaxID=6596 RepID=UPI00234F668D|nr:uncharacterized protein LOC123545483 [Mercenaria mercenaria]
MPKRQRRSRGNSGLYDELHVSPPKRKYDVENAVGGADAKSADLPKDEEKKITRMSPKTILFSQDTINYKFEDGTKLNETLNSLKFWRENCRFNSKNNRYTGKRAGKILHT